MSDNDIMSKITGVFRIVFSNEGLDLSRTTTAQEVECWDSLMHINLIVAIEREFKIRLTTREINGLRNVGDLIDIVARKTAAGA